jgi:hypothetical protein
MYAVTNKREIARRAKNLKLRAVQLKNLVINLKRSTGVDMQEEIIEYLKERLEEDKI